MLEMHQKKGRAEKKRNIAHDCFQCEVDSVSLYLRHGEAAIKPFSVFNYDCY